MSQSVRYLIDTDVFITAKNLYYRYAFCEAFWQWLVDAHHEGLVFSIEKVRKEINNGKKNDLVRNWMNNELPDSFFIPDTHDIAVMQKYKEVMLWNTSNTHYTPSAKAEFASADKADAFLVATAFAHGYTVVTQEKSNPDRKKKVMIPDAANNFGVKTLLIYDLLSQYATDNFNFKL